MIHIELARCRSLFPLWIILVELGNLDGVAMLIQTKFVVQLACRDSFGADAGIINYISFDVNVLCIT